MRTYSEIARELLDFMRDCHSDEITDMPPDDHKFLFIVQSLNAIANSKGEDAPKYADCLGDSYTSNHDLCSWLASNTSRYLYCNKATDRNGQTKGIMQTLRNGYDLERELVFNKTVDYLTTLLEQEEQNKNKGETDILCPFCGAETEYKQRQGMHLWVCSECPMVMFEYHTKKDVYMLARELDGPKNQLIAKDVLVKQERE